MLDVDPDMEFWENYFLIGIIRVLCINIFKAQYNAVLSTLMKNLTLIELSWDFRNDGIRLRRGIYEKMFLKGNNRV